MIFGLIDKQEYDYKHLDKKEEALKYYLKAIELDEKDKYSIADIAWIYNILGNYKEALKY